MATLRSLCILVFAALAASRRGAPPPPPIPENDWAVRHLAGTAFRTAPRAPLAAADEYRTEEHHVDNYNAGAFFLLHDFDSSGGWSHAEVRRLYGLDDESNKDVPEARKQEALDTVFRLFDDNGNGVIERDEFTRKDAAGARLPDVGVSAIPVPFQGRGGRQT